MAHLNVRPTKIRVKSDPPFKKRKMGHLSEIPAAKADCELALFRWTEVQLPC
jgi:hypothetical protein